MVADVEPGPEEVVDSGALLMGANDLEVEYVGIVAGVLVLIALPLPWLDPDPRFESNITVLLPVLGFPVVEP